MEVYLFHSQNNILKEENSTQNKAESEADYVT